MEDGSPAIGSVVGKEQTVDVFVQLSVIWTVFGLVAWCCIALWMKSSEPRSVPIPIRLDGCRHDTDASQVGGDGQAA